MEKPDKNIGCYIVQFLDLLQLTFAALFRQKLQAAVAVFAVMIAVLGMILIAGKTLYEQKLFQETLFDFYDMHLLTIKAPYTVTWDKGEHLRRDILLEQDIIELEVLPGVAEISPYILFTTELKTGREVENLRVVGGPPEIVSALRWHILRGREIDPQNTQAECLVSEEAQVELFGGDALGKTARLGGREVRVVGIFKSTASLRGTRGKLVFIDQSLARVIALQKYPSAIAVRVDSSDKMDQDIETIKKLRASLESSLSEIFGENTGRRLVAAETDEMKSNMEINAKLYFSAMIFLVLGLFIAISIVAELLYADIHSNIAEIGLLRALGASKVRIAAEVIARGMIICLIGGILGIVISYGYYLLPDKMQYHFQWRTMPGLNLIAFVMATFAGLASSIVPAVSAIQVDPITALQEPPN